MRTKFVKIDNAEFEIGGLSTNQVVEFSEDFEERLKGKSTQEQSAYFRERNALVASWGLNNAYRAKKLRGDAVAVGDEWSVARVLEEIDVVELKTLVEAILAFSGVETRVVQPGELQAAAEQATPSLTPSAAL